jgi:hypothetical protein
VSCAICYTKLLKETSSKGWNMMSSRLGRNNSFSFGDHHLLVDVAISVCWENLGISIFFWQIICKRITITRGLYSGLPFDYRTTCSSVLQIYLSFYLCTSHLFILLFNVSGLVSLQYDILKTFIETNQTSCTLEFVFIYY